MKRDKKLEEDIDFALWFNKHLVPQGEIPDWLYKSYKETKSFLDKVKKQAKTLDKSLESNPSAKGGISIDVQKGELYLNCKIEVSLWLGLYWMCDECKRPFVAESPAWAGRGGSFPQEYSIYICKECVSYWYDRENYGKEKPDYLIPRRKLMGD